MTKSEFENKDELLKDLNELIWRVKHTYPVLLPTGKLTQQQFEWIKEKSNISVIKLNGGYKKSEIC